ncbi:hypothetical protein FH972_023893 [Carpinus fangiana]|uniref:Protein kinase domain-containing protein n=1 Tax=Carpinus fangiana TaxID=176857 RepID=A0A5N6KZ02_9ROSI|nr:hypothetical protein FH972_023893 [Carpinus fangiana]
MDLTEEQPDPETRDALPTLSSPLQARSWVPSLPKFPLTWRRKAADDTVSLPADTPDKLETDTVPLSKRPSREVVPGVPRPLTFKRQDSERREKLQPFELPHEQRRARLHTFSSSRSDTPPKSLVQRASEPDLREAVALDAYSTAPPHDISVLTPSSSCRDLKNGPLVADGHMESDPETASEDGVEDAEWQKDVDKKWILNLSMAFRDKSDREKFFLTYAEEPNRWRRLTISVDYRDAPDDSLESDLKSLHYQRDKSSRIYESIHESLPSIRFFDTVTNLKLQTTDGRLHVHVTEDVNEIIPYPSASAIRHLDLRPQELVRESALHFDSHLSGFVYKVRHNGRTYIKKEIPAPEMVEEFLYEINALCALRDEPDVIDLEGIVLDDNQEKIKGLLLSYASRGALIDYLYDHKTSPDLDWERQEKWARQIIGGLAAIHEHGFVQGDFTLSNIVIDGNDNAKVIDINRRGCPVGWEPPEFKPLIENGQRISMFIGVRSDLYQLGMVLWGLGRKIDEPEREEPPLNFEDVEPEDDVPDYFKTVVDLCLRELPKERVAAAELLRLYFSSSVTFSREEKNHKTTQQEPQDETPQGYEYIEARNCKVSQPTKDENPAVEPPPQEDVEIDLDGAAAEVLGAGHHSDYLGTDYSGFDGAFSGAGGQFADVVSGSRFDAPAEASPDVEEQTK